MLYRTELFDIFIFVQSDIAVLILSVSHSTVRICVPVEFTLTKGILNTCDILVTNVLSTGHVDAINMFGREQ
eukprot:5588916-Pyramimonas_sp.AAC.1